jgi:hypothetical protein
MVRRLHGAEIEEVGCASGDLKCRRECRIQTQKSSRPFSLNGCLSAYLGLVLCLRIGR